MIEVNKIYQSDCLGGLKKLPAECVDCVITSPPYWSLRDYKNEKQIGNELNFFEFVNNLCAVFAEVRRVLKPTGTLFVNLGDTYNGNKIGNTETIKNPGAATESFKKEKIKYLRDKTLCMIPERFAIQMVDNGWVLRNQIIWHKPNQMPQSATDRFTVDFEKVFFFTKQSTGYYFDQQKEPSLTYENRPAGVVRDREYGYDSKQDKIRVSLGKKSFSRGQAAGKGVEPSGNATKDFYEVPFERNMRTVWSINTEPFSEDHFACYPQLLVDRLVKCGCPENGVVLDPFMGAGTTALVASKLNRNFIGFELNSDYIEIAKKRLQNELGMFNKLIA